MKAARATCFLAFLLVAVSGWAQSFKLYQTDNIHNQLRLDTRTGEVYQVQDDGQKFLVHPASTSSGKTAGRYSLYKTENIWTFLLLDTFSGKLWQCQFSVQGDEYRSSWVINPHALVASTESRFRIEPLTSMYQFYLVDDETGDIWKFQWSNKGDGYRWIEKH